MAHCYLTGVQFPLEEGYVLNRREVHHLLHTLRDRIGSLQHLIEQLAGLDDTPDEQWGGGGISIRQRHRLVCKAVAEALAPGFPEIELFRIWPEYLAAASLVRLQSLQGHPLYGNAINALADDELLAAVSLGKRVLCMLDPRHELTQRARVAITAGICVRNHAAHPEELVRRIRSSVFENHGLGDLGVPASEQEYLLPYLDVGCEADSTSQPAGNSGHHDEAIA